MNMNTKIRQSRLTRLADYLENLPPNRKFDMRTWGTHPTGTHTPPEENYCGTAACALGHAAMIPKFQKLGLQIAWHQPWGEGSGFPWSAEITYKDEYDSYAGALFFGLTDREASNLFLSIRASRRRTINKLRKLATLPYQKGK